jgi:hypothetical protein
MIDVASLCKRYEKLKGDRNVLDNHCQEIAERILPYRADFTVQRTMGEKRQERVFDATASIALTRFVSAFTSMITPEGQRWHGLTSSNAELNKILAVREYYEAVASILFRERYRGGFGSQVQEVFTSLGAFGTGSYLIEPSKKGGIYYKAQPLSKYWVAENDEGKIDTVYRSYQFTAHQAYQHFKELTPKIILDQLQDSPDKVFDFFQCIMPNEDYQDGRLDYKGMKYASYDICMQDKEKMVKVGGYHEFPMPVSRFMTIAGEPYGYSPAMTVLPDVKMLNEMEKTNITAAHLLTSPPWLIADDLMGSAINFKPSALNYGGVNAAGQQLIQPMMTGGNPNISLEMTQQKRQVINDAFYVSLFQILVETREMTATEVVERAREKAALLAPSFSRQNVELISPTVERELGILARQGKLPDMPPELIEAQGEYEVVYDSPLARAQRSEETAGFARTMEMITPIAQLDQSVLAMFDFEQTARGLADLNGMPARWMRTPEEVAALREQQAQAQQAQQLMQAAPILADVQKKQAEAQQIAMAGASGRL